MASIDPNIALSIRPAQIESPLAHAARAAELQGSQQTQFMNMLKMKEFADETRNKNAMTKWLATKTPQDLNSDENLNQLATQYGAQGLALAKQIDERRKAQGEALYRAAQTSDLGSQEEKRRYELGETQRTNAIKTISGFRSRQDALDMLYESEANGTIPAAAAEGIRRRMPYNEEDFPAFKQELIATLMPAEKQLEYAQPKPEKLELGGKIVLVDMNPNSATYKQVIREDVKTATPRQEQLLTPEEERQKVRIAAASRAPAQSDNPAKVAHTSTDDQGNVTFYNAFGQVIRKETNAGKRSPNVIKAEQAAQNLGRDIARTTKELAEITKDGGLIDQSTGSYAGKAIDVGARIFGKAMPGDIAAGKLAPISDMVLKMVPRFEGPQSDKDTQSYKEAAGQLADPNLPREIRKAAGKEILRLMRERKKEFGVEGMEAAPAAPAAPAPKSDVRSKADAILGNP